MEVFNLVFRNLRARPIRSFLTLLGIIVATASMALFLSFGEGLRKALSSEFSKIGPAILVLPEGVEAFSMGLPELTPATLAKIEAAKEELGIADVYPTAVLARGGMDPSSSFVFYGLPDGVNPSQLYPGSLLEGGSFELSSGSALLGGKVAERSNLSIGKVLRISPEISLTVTGILKSTGGLSDNISFVPIGAVQKALGTKNFTTILVNLKDGQKSDVVAAALKKKIPGIDAQTAGDVQKYAERAVRISDLVRFGISLVALIVGGLLVANTVMMSVFERIREFGLMRALGAKRKFIFQLVLLEALLLSLSGGVLGILLAEVASYFVNLFTQSEVGIPLSAITFRLGLFAFLVAVSLGLLAGFFPARLASRLKVVEALGRV